MVAVARLSLVARASVCALAPVLLFACGGDQTAGPAGTTHAGGSSGSTATGGQGGLGFGAGGSGPVNPFDGCSEDGTAVVDAEGNVLATCQPDELCAGGECLPACQAAETRRSSVGCDYLAVHMDALKPFGEGCFAAFVANLSPVAATVALSYDGSTLDLGPHAAIPKGTGQGLSYEPFDPAVGVPPGEVAILFLGGNAFPTCPLPPAVPSGSQIAGTGRTHAFRIRTGMPVVAYQMLPYGGGIGNSWITGATLLLPTSVWDGNYVGVNAYALSEHVTVVPPSLDLAAKEDGTTVTILPKVAIEGGPDVPAAGPDQPASYALDAGEVLQLSQLAELTGSPIAADKPIGLWAGHVCMTIPKDMMGSCDHGEQQIPPIRALGREYVAVPHEPRDVPVPDEPIWRLVGVVDGTTLAFEPEVGGPTKLDLGQVVEFASAEPFVVRSQDADHPFLLMGHMSDSHPSPPPNITMGAIGDPEAVRITPPAQYLRRYVFFVDPTYPNTYLAVVRERGSDGFADVTIDCAGALGAWQGVGAAGDYEWTRFHLVDAWVPAGACGTGRREMSSKEPFGVWVWGWGADVSYAYPAGEGVELINEVEVPPIPK
jgi:hypothetical protein